MRQQMRDLKRKKDAQVKQSDELLGHNNIGMNCFEALISTVIAPSMFSLYLDG